MVVCVCVCVGGGGGGEGGLGEGGGEVVETSNFTVLLVVILLALEP